MADRRVWIGNELPALVHSMFNEESGFPAKAWYHCHIQRPTQKRMCVTSNILMNTEL